MSDKIFDRNIEYYKGLFEQARMLQDRSRAADVDQLTTAMTTNPKDFEALVSRLTEHTLQSEKKAKKKKGGLISNLVASAWPRSSTEGMRAYDKAKRGALGPAVDITFPRRHREDDIR